MCPQRESEGKDTDNMVVEHQNIETTPYFDHHLPQGRTFTAVLHEFWVKRGFNCIFQMAKWEQISIQPMPFSNSIYKTRPAGPYSRIFLHIITDGQCLGGTLACNR